MSPRLPRPHMIQKEESNETLLRLVQYETHRTRHMILQQNSEAKKHLRTVAPARCPVARCPILAFEGFLDSATLTVST